MIARSEVDRLGFEAWADNVIVDRLENIDTSVAGTSVEDDGTLWVRIETSQDRILVSVKAYVQELGWQMHEREIKP
jgi:hypothetical protein